MYPLYPEGARAVPETLFKYELSTYHVIRKRQEIPTSLILMHELGKILPKDSFKVIENV